MNYKFFLLAFLLFNGTRLSAQSGRSTIDDPLTSVPVIFPNAFSISPKTNALRNSVTENGTTYSLPIEINVHDVTGSGYYNGAGITNTAIGNKSTAAAYLVSQLCQLTTGYFNYRRFR